MITYQEAPQRTTGVAQRPSWREEAVAARRQSERTRPLAMRAELAARVQALTDSVVPPDSIQVDRQGSVAIVAVDGLVFQLQQHRLSVVRPCAYCGTGQFTSPAITSPDDLGYAITDWDPRHDDCQETDEADTF